MWYCVIVSSEHCVYLKTNVRLAAFLLLFPFFPFFSFSFLSQVVLF